MKKEKTDNPFSHLGQVAGDLFRIAPLEMCNRLLYAIVTAILGVLTVNVTAALFDAAATGPENRLLTLGAGLCACIGIPMLVDVFRWVIVNIHLSIKARIGFSEKLFAHNLRLPLERFEDPDTYDRRFRAKMAIDQEHIISLFLYAFDILPQALTVAGVTAALFAFSPLLVPLALIGVVPTIFTSILRVRWWHNLRKGQLPAEKKREYLWNVLMKKDTVKEARALHFGGYIRAQWQGLNDTIVGDKYMFAQKTRIKLFLSQLAQTLCYALCIALSCALLLRGEISIGAFGACLSTFGRLQGLVSGIVNNLARITETADFVNDYYRYFDIPAKQEGAEDCAGFTDSIEAENVSFRYPGALKLAVDGVNLRIRKGERVVIVGENGSGKTTLSKLFTGAFAPTAGRVSLGGRDIASIDPTQFTRDLSLIGQNFGQYPLSLRENVAFSDTARVDDDKAIASVLHDADAEEIVAQIGGLDAALGREFGGFALSGGQWQKIAIARGMFRKSRWIVLDEPTAALDPLVEYDILSRFLSLTHDKTAIIISHRVGLCRHADRILVMKNGRLVEQGTHDALLAQGGEYTRIWNEQARWYA